GLGSRPEEIEYIDRLAGEGSSFYLPCGDESIFSRNREWTELLIERGWEVKTSSNAFLDLSGVAPRAFAAGGGNQYVVGSDVESLEFPGLESEVRGILARAKAAVIGGIPLQETAVVCRDLDLYVPTIVATAREYGLPVAINHRV